MNMKSFALILTSLISTLMFCQCTNNAQITQAAHRTTPSKEISGVVTSSYPIKYTKRSGAGAAIGSIGGAVLGSRIGSGYSARLAGSLGGSLLGGLGGNAAEGAIRTRSAREITVRADGRNFRTINSSNPPLEKGDRVLVLTNVYGHPLRVIPLN